MKARIGTLGVFALFAAFTGCGGGDSGQPSVTVAVTPSTATLRPGDLQNFTATVTGTANAAVTWTVQEGTTGGTITAQGAYSAPLSDGTYHVIAASQVNPADTAMATITVAGTFAIFPASDVLGPMGVSTFSASVEVTWSVREGAAGGTITANGFYTSPGTPGLFHVVATSVQAPSMTTTADVQVVPAGFVPTGAMSTGRTAHTATVLPSGKVLIAGGDGCYIFSYYYGHCLLNSAELYDPGTGTFATTGSMADKRSFHTATLLGNGKVLVVGGSSAKAELYDPVTGKFSATGSMKVARDSHTATLLGNGKVLIAGGESLSGALATAELYDAGAGTFSATGTMTAARISHSATLLADGTVLIAGGTAAQSALATAEIYDPTTGSFTATNSMAIARVNNGATILGNSKVLVAGGFDKTLTDLGSAEIYDGATGAFTATGSMSSARGSPFAILLASGAVLVSGGGGFTADLYDVASGSFTQTGSMGSARVYPAAALLQDGRVLVTGGSDSTSAELFQ